MRVIRFALLVAMLAAGTTVGHAQILVQGWHWINVNVNQINNAGFEVLSSSAWNETGSYIDTTEGDQIYEGFGHYTTSSHSGKYGWDFNVGEGSYNEFFNSVLNQNLSSPVLGGWINTASVYVFAEDQELELTIFYNDGSSTYTDFQAYASQAPQGSNGWQLWNFLPAINPNKYVTGIQFASFSGYGSDIVIDDVALDVYEWIALYR